MAWLKSMLFLAMAFAVIAAGCGDGDESSAGTAEDQSASSSKAAFIEEASAACRKAREKSFQSALAYGEKHESDGLPPEVLAKRTSRAVLVPIFETEIEDLRGLEPPPGEEEEIEAILAANETDLEEVKAKKLVLPTDYFSDADKVMQDYGLIACMKRNEEG